MIGQSVGIKNPNYKHGLSQGKSVRYSMFHNAFQRAKRDGLPFSINLNDVVIPDVCPLLGIPLLKERHANGPADNSPSIDRIVPVKGYVPGNILIVSKRANAIKNNATLAELEAITSNLRRIVYGA